MVASAAGLGSQLRIAVLRLSRRLRREGVAGGQVTASQLSALSAVAKHGEMTLGELASHERVAPPSMTRIAARLEEAGFLERRADPSDRRVVWVGLSAAGAALLEDVRSRRDAYLASRLGELNAEELQALAKAVPLLERLAGEDP
jgi:DNA-binding MarR family transcriptional regulator